MREKRIRDYGKIGRYAFLDRILRGKIGQPWQEIHQELMSKVDRRTDEGFRMRDAIKSTVRQNIGIDSAGVLYDVNYSTWLDGRTRPITGYYVHPKRGTLEYAVMENLRIQRPVNYIPIEKNENYSSWYQKIDGLWYLMEKVRVSIGKHLRYWYKDPGPENPMCEVFKFDDRKRQISSSEIKNIVLPLIAAGKGSYIKEKEDGQRDWYQSWKESRKREYVVLDNPNKL